MYNISETGEEFNTFLLEDRKNNAKAKIAVSRGGILTSFCADGRELIYLNRDTLYDINQNVRGGCPILFPICGRLHDKTYKVNDTEYSMDLHGFARTLPWKVINTQINGGASLTIMLESSDETKNSYPFDFRLEYTYELKDGFLVIRQETINTSACVMPFCCGLHPYFKIDRESASARIPARRMFDVTNNNMEIEFDGIIKFTGHTEYIVKKINDTPPALETGLGYRIELQCSDAYQYYVVWSPEDAEFACIEPWTAKPDAFNTGESVMYLKPGERFIAETKIIYIT